MIGLLIQKETCSIDHIIKDSNSNCFVGLFGWVFFLFTSISAFWNNCSLLLFYLILPGKPFCFCPVCKRQQMRCQPIATDAFSWCSFLLLPTCSLCELIVTTKVEDRKISSTSLNLKADEKEGSNVPATSAISVTCCSPKSALALHISPGRMCLRAMMSILYWSQFPESVYLIFYLYKIEKMKARNKI